MGNNCRFESVCHPGMQMDSNYTWTQPEHAVQAQRPWMKAYCDLFVQRLLKHGGNSSPTGANPNLHHHHNHLFGDGGATRDTVPAPPVYSSVSHIKESWHNPPVRLEQADNGGCCCCHTRYSGHCHSDNNHNTRLALSLEDHGNHSFSNQVLDLIKRKREYNKASTFGYEIQLQTGMLSTVTTDVYPWNIGGKVYEKSIDGLHDEIKDFYQYIVPTAEEQQMRQAVVARLKRVVKEEWPNADVDVFGSFKTELNLPTSDIDVVIFGQWDNPLWTLNDIIKRSGIASDCKVLDRATVPIVKMTDKETEVRIDISFNMRNGIKSAELIKSFIKEYPQLPQLVLLLKQYLLQRDLNEVWTGGISSYSLILMCVSFMKLRATKMSQNPDNLGETLMLFLELYGRNFDYFNTGIRTEGDICHVPKEDLLKKMEGNHWSSILCIEDPLNSGNDIGRSSYGALHIKLAFDYAYTTLSRVILPQSAHLYEESISILGRIIRITPEVMRYREFIRQKFSKKYNAEEMEKSIHSNGIKLHDLSSENDFKKDYSNTNNSGNQKMSMTTSINEQGDIPCKNESLNSYSLSAQKKPKSFNHKKSTIVSNNSNINCLNNHSSINGKISNASLKAVVSNGSNHLPGLGNTNSKHSPLKKNESEYSKHSKKTKVTTAMQ